MVLRVEGVGLMRKKLNSESGLTLVEMLCAVAILVLLVLLLSTGMQMALRTYRDIVAQSEVDLLLSTAVDAIADDLRYAQDVTTGADGKLSSYTSDSFGKGASIELNDKNQIVVNGMRLLPTGAYGLNEAYRVDKEKMSIQYNEPDFTIALKVVTKDEKISAETSVTVRCLNAKKDATGGGA